MVPIYEARAILHHWNAGRPVNQRIAMETVEEAINAFRSWQIAVASFLPPDACMFRLLRHHEFLRQLPVDLLQLLTDDFDETNETDEGTAV